MGQHVLDGHLGLAADKREGSGGLEDAEAGVVLLSSGVRQGPGAVTGH